MVDNRPRLEVDPKKLHLWEIEMIEGTTTQGLLVLCRYLMRNGRPVSPDLPETPVDELSRKEMVILKNSDAYKQLRRFRASDLEAALKSVKDAAGF